MADQDDDDADLVQLKQLRQVWLAMPDEEPPMKGLDALMAAARTKAEEMKPAPWWKRMFAVMVKPPALALATIVVVAGGAILVHNHRDEVEVVEVAKPEVAAREEAPAAPPAPAGGVLSAGSAAPADTAATQLDEKQALAPAHHAGTTKRKSPASSGSKGDAARGDPGEDKLMLSQQVAPPPPPPPPPPAPTMKPPAEKPVDRTVDKPVAKAPMPTAESAGPSGVANSNDKDSNAQPMAAQLLAKARAAAERSDCASVKQLLEQIAKLDVAYYRNTAVKDATIGRCMQIAD